MTHIKESITKTTNMANEIYLTGKLLLCNDKMYYDTKKGRKPVKSCDWHIHLQEYGYHKLPKKWITRLNRESDVRPKNSQYGMMDVDSDGNCMYHCFANSLNDRDNYEQWHTCESIREMICEGITEDDYRMCINVYRAMKDASDFENEWDPHKIDTIHAFREVLRESGHTYWGDFLIISILKRILNINIVILTSNDELGIYDVYNTGFEYDPTRDTVCLIHENETHFQLVGKFNGHRMITYFRAGNLPVELFRLAER